jgi:spermidine/putrescine transport system permease protein
MIPSLPRPRWLRTATAAYLAAFLAFLVPAADRRRRVRIQRRSLPGAALARLHLGLVSGKCQIRAGRSVQGCDLLGSIWTSLVAAVWVTVLSVLIGTSNAFLIERKNFAGKQVLSTIDAGAAGDSRSHSRNLHSRVREPGGGVRR